MKHFNFKKEVPEVDESVLVDFWAEWCGPRRAINPTIESLAGRFQVSSIPALMIFKNGQITAQHLGITPESTLR